jgi:cytochrome c oxidase assembly protein subunit 15
VLPALVALVGLTSASGALVAGLRAGRVFNTFPLMAGRVVPPGYGQLSPWWRNLFENHAAVQFDHRVLAITTFAAAVATWITFRRSAPTPLARRLDFVLAAALLQLGLGIATLLLAVPVSLGVAHQGGAALLLVAAILAWHADAPRAARES